jgi:hypothetical protein
MASVPQPPQPHNIPTTVGQRNIGPGAAPGPLVGRNHFVGSCYNYQQNGSGPQVASPQPTRKYGLCCFDMCHKCKWAAGRPQPPRPHSPIRFPAHNHPRNGSGPSAFLAYVGRCFYDLLGGGMDHKQSLTWSPSWSKLSRGDKAALGDNSRDS